jgi:DHA1 family multidrug resistance protein-like MFS transporter
LQQDSYWRRNLAALWFAQFTAIMGFSFAFPFLPVYLQVDLGVRSGSELAIWTGVASGVSGLAMAIMSPIWGALADRFGRKAMMLRATIAGAICVLLMALARGPIDLTVLRFLQGATAGTVAAAMALVAGETPRNRVGWALGMLSSAVAVGSSAGPLLGGAVGAVFGLRATFIVGGCFLFLAMVPVLLLVRETPPAARPKAAGPAMSVLRAHGVGTLNAVALLIICVALMQMGYTGYQPLIVLRLVELMHSGVTAVTGVAFAIAGLAAAGGSIWYPRFARRFGYISVITVSGLAMVAAFVVTGLVPSVPVMVAGVGAAGLFYGVMSPAIATMLGLEAPVAVQARVFGASASATAIGFGLGPILGGGSAAALGVSTAIVLIALFPLLVAVIMPWRGREPVR